MALSKDQIVDQALIALDGHGLESLSMRSLAKELGVRAGALYWHVASKQDLLAAVADRILEPAAFRAAPEEPDKGRGRIAAARRIAVQMRAAILTVRDGAEIVLLAQALAPAPLAPGRLLGEALADVLPTQEAEWGARTLTHYVLGSVAEEQNHAELARAGIVPDHESAADDAFGFGLDAILTGLERAATRSD